MSHAQIGSLWKQWQLIKCGYRQSILGKTWKHKWAEKNIVFFLTPIWSFLSFNSHISLYRKDEKRAWNGLLSLLCGFVKTDNSEPLKLEWAVICTQSDDKNRRVIKVICKKKPQSLAEDKWCKASCAPAHCMLQIPPSSDAALCRTWQVPALISVVVCRQYYLLSRQYSPVVMISLVPGL